MNQLIEVLLSGLGRGAIYAMLALGFVIIYKSTSVISFAQPALMMSGAVMSTYLAVWLSGAIGGVGLIASAGAGFASGVVFFAALILAALLTAVVALVIERLAIRPMVGRPVFIVAIITIGIDIILRQLAVGFIGANRLNIRNPWGIDRIGPEWFRIEQRYLVALAVLAVVLVLLFGFYRYTKYGLAMRAAAFDQEAALTQGISVGSVFALSWAIAAALAATAGTLLAAGPGGVGQTFWLTALIALPAIILGGLDSLEGAVVGGLTVGLVQALVGSYERSFPIELGNNAAAVAPYALMLLVLLIKPYGLFGTPEVRRV